MTLRHYDAARDQALVLAWANAPDAAPWMVDHPGAVEEGDLVAWCAEPLSSQWIFECAGRPAGFGTIRIYEQEAYVRFGRLLVDPAQRHQGIGRSLAQAIVAQARALRPNWPVYARIAPGNEAALLLYPSVGLVPLEPLPPGCDDSYLWLTFMEHDHPEPGGSFDDEP